MKAIYSTSKTTFFALYGNKIEIRTHHQLFWGLISFTTKRISTNRLA